MPFDFEVGDTFPASPQRIYDAWLDSIEHAAMTGSDFADISPDLGATFEVWDGSISGHNLELEPGRRIVQAWRATNFAESDADSRVTVKLEPEGVNTRVTVVHENVPDGHTGYRDGGWKESYFDPMRSYFTR